MTADIAVRLRFPFVTMLADGKVYLAEKTRDEMNETAAEIEQLQAEVRVRQKP